MLTDHSSCSRKRRAKNIAVDKQMIDVATLLPLPAGAAIKIHSITIYPNLKLGISQFAWCLNFLIQKIQYLRIGHTSAWQI